MADKEAKDRIKIHHLFKEAMRCFFNNENDKAKTFLENDIKILLYQFNKWSNDFTEVQNGFHRLKIQTASKYCST
ncbi:MAG: hypothetical protein KA886_02465 [Candidatus Cloacimonetes bacterium]|nr:hypothetical protein [Candidatus Cloacimonadota bacterium]